MTPEPEPDGAESGPPQPHDAFFKEIFSDPDYAALFFQRHLSPSLVSRLDWASLKPVAKSFVKRSLRQMHADLLFTAPLDGNRSALLYLLTGEVAGFYTLAYGAVEYEETPERIRKGLARHRVPVMILARLAVARPFHGMGVGKHLLRDALLRTLQAAEIAGLQAVVVRAKDEEAVRFYRHYRFESFSSDPLKLILLLKDLRALL